MIRTNPKSRAKAFQPSGFLPPKFLSRGLCLLTALSLLLQVAAAPQNHFEFNVARMDVRGSVGETVGGPAGVVTGPAFGGVG